MSIVRLNGSNLGLIKDEVRDGEGYSTPVADDKIAKNMEVIEHSAEKAKVTKAMKMPITEPKPPQLTGDEDDIQKVADGIGKSGTTTIKRTGEKKEEPKPVKVDESKEESEQKAKSVDELIHKAANTFIDEFTKPDDGEVSKLDEIGTIPEGIFKLIDGLLRIVKNTAGPGTLNSTNTNNIQGIDDETLQMCMYSCKEGDYIAELLIAEYRAFGDTSVHKEETYRQAIAKYYELGDLSLRDMNTSINAIKKVLAKGLM